jgi:hypothetical protein
VNAEPFNYSSGLWGDKGMKEYAEHLTYQRIFTQGMAKGMKIGNAELEEQLIIYRRSLITLIIFLLVIQCSWFWRENNLKKTIRDLETKLSVSTQKQFTHAGWLGAARGDFQTRCREIRSY